MTTHLPGSGRMGALLRAAEPRDPKPTAWLVDRLAATGLLSGARVGGREAEPGALRDRSVAGLAYDSRLVTPGGLFVAIVGEHVDGHDYLEAAHAGGATLALVAHPTPAEIDQLVVADTRRALAVAAAWWYGDPSARLGVVETTSHGLALHRVDEIGYDVAILTNLTHEHLELHGTFEAYRAAKLSLFERLARRGPGRPWPAAGIVNADDGSAPLFATAARAAGARLLTYGTSAAADVRASAIEDDGRRLRLRAATPRWEGSLTLRLAGRFNAWNALAVLALGEALDLDPEAVRAGLESVEAVPGRMERIDLGQPFGVVIDYAHSPASLEGVLSILEPAATARGGGLIAVFGSAGDRDRAKRPMMGRIAGRRCRLVVVTDEDPRSEDPMAILDEIARGAEEAGRRRGDDLLLIPDRPTAIAAAFARARPGDVVLLAGKGHERSIIHGTEARPYDERTTALAALAALAPASGWAEATE